MWFNRCTMQLAKIVESEVFELRCFHNMDIASWFRDSSTSERKCGGLRLAVLLFSNLFKKEGKIQFQFLFWMWFLFFFCSIPFVVAYADKMFVFGSVRKNCAWIIEFLIEIKLNWKSFPLCGVYFTYTQVYWK